MLLSSSPPPLTDKIKINCRRSADDQAPNRTGDPPSILWGILVNEADAAIRYLVIFQSLVPYQEGTFLAAAARSQTTRQMHVNADHGLPRLRSSNMAVFPQVPAQLTDKKGDY